MSHAGTTSTQARPIVTPEDVWDAKPETKTAWGHRFMEGMCRAACEQIERETGRQFNLLSHTAEAHWGNGQPDLRLNNAPIISLDEVRWRGSVVQDITISNAKTGLVHNTAGWGGTPAYENKRPMFLSESYDNDLEPFFPQGDGEPPWQFDYTAGYDQIPFELIMAGVSLVLFRLALAKNEGMTQETIGRYSYTADKAMSQQPFMDTIRSYRISLLPRR